MNTFPIIAEHWWAWIIAASWQIAALTILIAVAALLTRRLSARFRYVLWALILLKVFTPPSLNANWSISNWGIAPTWHYFSPRSVVSTSVGKQPQPGVIASLENSRSVVLAPTGAQLLVGKASQTPGALPGSSTPSQPPSPRLLLPAPNSPPRSNSPFSISHSSASSLSSFISHLSSIFAPSSLSARYRAPVPSLPFLLWLLGGAAFLSLVLFRYFRLTRLLRTASELDEGPIRVFLEKQALSFGRDSAPPLLLSPDVTSPFLFGLFRPRIVLPADLPDTLKPNWECNLILNAPSFNNFQSESGIPLDPVPYNFKTKGE